MITNMDRVRAAGVTASAVNAGEFTSRGIPFLAGCAICGAVLAPYNSHPTRTGYIVGSCCISGMEPDEDGEPQGFATVAEFDLWQTSEIEDYPLYEEDDDAR